MRRGEKRRRRHDLSRVQKEMAVERFVEGCEGGHLLLREWNLIESAGRDGLESDLLEQWDELRCVVVAMRTKRDGEKKK